MVERYHYLPVGFSLSLSLCVSAGHISSLLFLSDCSSVSEMIPKIPWGAFLSLDVHYL